METTVGSDQVSAGAEERRMKMKVVVGIDGSDGSFYALKWALDNLLTCCMATKTTGTKVDDDVGMVFLVNVQSRFNEYAYPVGPPSADARLTTSSVKLGESVTEDQERKTTEILSRALQMCKEKLVKAETHVLVGDPREMLCQAAEQLHADLLIMGSRGMGMLKRTLLGSASDYCAHHAKPPTLIVKPPSEDSKKH